MNYEINKVKSHVKFDESLYPSVALVVRRHLIDRENGGNRETHTWDEVRQTIYLACYMVKNQAWEAYLIKDADGFFVSGIVVDKFSGEIMFGSTHVAYRGCGYLKALMEHAKTEHPGLHSNWSEYIPEIETEATAA